MNTHPKKQLRIIQCRDSLMWYASLVGQTVPYLGTWPEGYRSREPAGYINVVRLHDAELIDVEADSPTNPFPENPPERRTLQAAGEHPTPCARTCEANAFRIEIRGLKAERDALAAELKSLREQDPPADIDPHDAMLQKQHDEAQGPLANAAHKVYFRAGLLACREHMARFVESQDPSIAASIRANWWPDLGPDMGPPRRIEWGELTEGEYGESGFRVKEPHEISPTIEALPIALCFLMPDERTTK